MNENCDSNGAETLLFSADSINCAFSGAYFQKGAIYENRFAVWKLADYVLAPVMLAGSESRLQDHSPPSLVRRFNYLRFAVDRGRDERGWVAPVKEHVRKSLESRNRNLAGSIVLFSRT